MRKTKFEKLFEELEEQVYGKRESSVKKNLTENRITMKEFEEEYLSQQSLEANKDRWENIINDNFSEYTEVKVDIFDNVLNAFIFDAYGSKAGDSYISDIAEALFSYIENSDVEIINNWFVTHADDTIEMGFELTYENETLIPYMNLVENETINETYSDNNKEKVNSMNKKVHRIVHAVSPYVDEHNINFEKEDNPEIMEFDFFLTVSDDTWELNDEEYMRIKEKLEKEPEFKNVEIGFWKFSATISTKGLYFVVKDEEPITEDENTRYKTNTSYTDLIEELGNINSQFKLMNSVKLNKVVSNFFIEEGYMDNVSMKYDVVQPIIGFYLEDENINVKDLALLIAEYYVNNEDSIDLSEDANDSDEIYYDYDEWLTAVKEYDSEANIKPEPNTHETFYATYKDTSQMIGKWYDGNYGKIFENNKMNEEKHKTLYPDVNLHGIIDILQLIAPKLASERNHEVIKHVSEYLYQNGYIKDKTSSTEVINDGLKKAIKDEGDEYGIAKKVAQNYADEYGFSKEQLLQRTSITEDKDEDDPCWDGYEMVGMKKDKDGNEVPNCVPKEKNESVVKEDEEDDPCWDGYEMVGMKKDKDGNEVPNCVPKVKENSHQYNENQSQERWGLTIESHFPPGNPLYSKAEKIIEKFYNDYPNGTENIDMAHKYAMYFNNKYNERLGGKNVITPIALHDDTKPGLGPQKFYEDKHGLTDKESEKLDKKREEIVLDLKDRKKEFKDRYGDDWESVMYGTATNIAKKELGLTENRKPVNNKYNVIVENNGKDKKLNVNASCKLRAQTKAEKYCKKKGYKFKKFV